ncbi:DUF4192 domain-containing protein [Nocardioides deserti]|uniref:DUF4192 domain-containing protein n=1 Tax=Nocardioides deserti TaxID=1588644 RepID=A0ABR6U376_9ACTN|nr:DUF4192 domain-containing protein [Nocardioides deserti]MBC2958867.1 DUF4192 domain-containing protein [Nocardioides deserti]GGO69417.1 hypothetical protein GCM10012276_05560 [Nocardioides deserti]
MTTSHPATGRSPFTARTTEDLLAAVPVVLGFRPHESVVLLTFGGDRSLHARIDVPTTEPEAEAAARQLLEPCRRQRVRAVALVVLTGDERAAAWTGRAVIRAFTRAGIDVVDAVRAHEGRWYVASGPRGDVPAHGVPYDVSAHPFAAQAVLEGRVTLDSREELEASVAASPAAVHAVLEAVVALPGGASSPAEESRWAAALVVRCVGAGTSPTDAEVARLVVGMLDVPVRDAAWERMRRADATAHVRFWTDVVRRTPDAFLAGPAALLAFAAWLSGHGALAWCAVDRCLDVAPGHRLAGYIAQVLTNAVPPTVWDDAGTG